MLACASPPAGALTQRGHSFAFSFGEPGTGDGQLSSPSSVAVDEHTGDVYVSDAANNRIDMFAPQRDGEGHITGYTFQSAWGWGVADGEHHYETCTAACLPGIASTASQEEGKHPGALDDPGQIAVDNSTSPTDPSRGDVYVIANRRYERSVIEKFSPTGEYLGLLADQEEAEYRGLAQGLAVDSNGLVWVSWEEEEITGYSDAQPTLPEAEYQLGVDETEGAPLRPGLAVSTITVGAHTQDRLDFDIEPGGEETEGKKASAWCTKLACTTAEMDAFTVEPSVSEEHHGVAHEFQEQLLVPRFSPASTTGLAADSSDQTVYLDTATAITAYDASGRQVQTFGGPEPGFAGLSGAGGLAVDHAAAQAVGLVLAADTATGQIDVFAPAPAGPPSVEALSASGVTATGAQLHATIDPAGAPGSYTFQYGTSPCTQGGCQQTPSQPLPETFGAQPFTATTGPLQPTTVYHYRVLATNHAGGEPHTFTSVEGAFTTPPASGQAPADGRVWELVSNAPAANASFEAISELGGQIQASTSGSALAYIASGTVGEPEGNRNLEVTQMLSTRQGSEGWHATDIDTPNQNGLGLSLDNSPEYRLFSTTLALALVQPFVPAEGAGRLAEPPLSPPLTPAEAGGQEKTAYLRDDVPTGAAQAHALEDLAPETCEPELPESCSFQQASANGQTMHNPGFLPLVTAANDSGQTSGGEPTHFGEVLRTVTATPDLRHVLLGSRVPLTYKGQPSEEGETVQKSQENLYEWTAGQLTLINLLPGASSPAPSTSFGYLGAIVRHAVSEDGSRVIFSADGGSTLYLRDTATSETVRLDVPQGVEESYGAGATFQTANADASRIFFTDTEPLLPGAGRAGTADLYVCELGENPVTHQPQNPITHTPDQCALTDLTPAHDGESAQVQGTVLGASEDGTSVYYAAQGVLTNAPNPQGEHASANRCAAEGALSGNTCNLYLDRYDPSSGEWQTTFVAALAAADQAGRGDSPDWKSPGSNGIDLGGVTSRVSPDGSHLAFMSERSLTGYDNEDATSATPGERVDEEVFEYTAPTSEEQAHNQPGTLVCVSCDPSGARPHGVFDPADGEPSVEGAGLLVDRPRIWEGRWLAGSVPGWTKIQREGALYQSRYLSNSGRLFFDSPADLLPAAVNEREDVYEYDPQGVPHGPNACATESQGFIAAAGGCLGLISSGESPHESAFLDASETGGQTPAGEPLAEGGADVFFISAAALAPQDTSNGFEVYDAHECSPASPCETFPPSETQTACDSTETCRPGGGEESPGPLGTPSASASPSSSSTAVSRGQVLATKTSSPPAKPAKPPTVKQKLAKALASCRRQHHRKRPRAACERSARRRYRPAAKKTNATRKGRR